MATNPHKIPLSEAVAMTARARAKGTLPIRAWRFNRDIFDGILAQPGATGIRIYFALDAKDQPTLVLVGTDAAEKDMVQGEIGEVAWPCPPLCDPDSPLLVGP